MKNYVRLKFLFILFFVSAFAVAQESPVVTLTIPYQNSLLYNRYLINPTFSFVGETDRNISMFSRTQWIAFNDSPKVYQLNYSGRFSERTGFGIALYQQNLGVITSFGGIGNVAYYVPFQEEMGLTLGSNIVFYNSGVDMSQVDAADPDPLLLSLDKRSLFSIHPGLNFNYKRFDIGAYAENIINYDFKSNHFVKDYSEPTFSGHFMYTYPLENQKGTLRALARFRNNHTQGFNSGLSFLANFPSLGWVQSGFDSYFGVAIGLGIHISKKLSVGYVYESATRLGMQNFGATHEFNLVFTLPNENLKIQDNKGTLNEPKSSNELIDVQDKTQEENPELIPNDSAENSEESNRSDQSDPENAVAEKQHNSNQPPPSIIHGVLEKMDESEIQKVFSKNTKFKRKSPDNIGEIIVSSVNSGYYIIAGVFSKHQNGKRLVANLHKKGITALLFVNPENNFSYVYLRYYNSKKESLAAYYSNLDNTYFDTIWILKVDKN